MPKIKSLSRGSSNTNSHVTVASSKANSMLAKNMNSKQFKTNAKKQGQEWIKEYSSSKLTWIYDLILRQSELYYGTCDAFCYYSRFRCCKSRQRLKTLGPKDFLMDVGIEKINKELDILNLIKMLKGYRILSQVFLNKND